MNNITVIDKSFLNAIDSMKWEHGKGYAGAFHDAKQAARNAIEQIKGGE